MQNQKTKLSLQATKSESKKIKRDDSTDRTNECHPLLLPDSVSQSSATIRKLAKWIPKEAHFDVHLMQSFCCFFFVSFIVCIYIYFFFGV